MKNGKHIPKKHLGQNWLIDETVIKDMIEEAEIKTDEVVIEVGPGEGVLTQALLQTGATVIAIEKDRDLHQVLMNRFLKYGDQFKLIPQDVRDLNLSEILSKQQYQVVANIPYYISGLLFRTFLTLPKQPHTLTMLVQREVADRIVAADDRQSVLSLSVRAYGQPIKIRNVKAGAFRPIPNVDSAVIQVRNINRDYFLDNNINETRWFQLIKQAFNQKRKTLGKSLKNIVNFDNIQPLKKKRPETLSLLDWVKIYNNVST